MHKINTSLSAVNIASFFYATSFGMASLNLLVGGLLFLIVIHEALEADRQAAREEAEE